MNEGARREEILAIASTLVAESGLATSMRDIADACGILQGSLYHHFPSKEAILIELVQRYLDDLDRVAKEALDSIYETDPRPMEERVIDFGRAIASCAVRHRAALLVTLYEPPVGASDELARLARQTPTAIHDAMVEVLRVGQRGGDVRRGIDLALLADRLCQSMLHHGVGDSWAVPGAARIPELRCRIVLEGLAVRPPSLSALDRSDALRAVREDIAGWTDDDGDDRVTHLRAVARSEFGRRGYEATTMRDVATASGLSIGTVYRCFPSKERLLESVMAAYGRTRRSGWAAVMQTASPPLEKLDALAWCNIALIERFGDEFRIQRGLLRQSPRIIQRMGSSAAQRRDIKNLLLTGQHAGDIHLEHANADLYTRCVYEAIWTPESIVHAVGARAAHALARDTVLAGVLTGTGQDRG